MSALSDQIGLAWSNIQGLSGARKASLIAVGLATFLSVAALAYWTNQVDYRVLFSQLSAEDAGNIVSKLQEKKIPYRISGGDAISVPADKVSELRLELAALGLPQGGGVGFEIFDKKNLGATEFEQQLNYRRALQGELARTIGSLDEILQSRVHIALPKDSLFIDQQKKATASVTLKLKPGRRLQSQQIDGIAHLVASSVEGLQVQDVMIVDNRGNILSRPQGESKFSKLSGSQIEYQRGIEKDLSGGIQSMLENVFGKGKVVVRVSSELDFRVMEKTEETFDPESQVVRSTQKQTERSAATSAVKTPAPGSAPGSEREKVDELINYEINKVVNKTIMPVGDIKKLSIAVLVDGIYAKGTKGEETYQPRPKAELDAIEDLVRKSSGFNAARGDQVVVSNMQFKVLDGDEMPPPSWQDRLPVLFPLFQYLVIVILAALLVFFVLKPFMRNLFIRSAPASVPASAFPQAAGTPAIPGGTVRPPLPMMEDKAPTEAELARYLAHADSKKFAELLRNWLK